MTPGMIRYVINADVQRSVLDGWRTCIVGVSAVVALCYWASFTQVQHAPGLKRAVMAFELAPGMNAVCTTIQNGPVLVINEATTTVYTDAGVYSMFKPMTCMTYVVRSVRP